ncbi:PREDICTED: phosphatidylinositol-glycan biosynthesis class F protein-like isoform X2 [Priapulus caudatus]|nr:PREDICTED: phosphatidylinositol-glycan biosynthesis class F protein-like isoform X2 [Priapulus caudatus]
MVYAVGTVLIYTVTVLFGAPLLNKQEETILFSLLLASCAILPGCCIFTTNWNRWLSVLTKSSLDQSVLEKSSGRVSVCTLIGAWLGAFPIPLDWDRPWQVWPISCVIGALVGYAMGNGVTTIQLCWQMLRARRKNSRMKLP